MIELKKIEETVASWIKPIPHLPTNGRKWLAENFWWLVLIGVILMGMSAIAMLNVLSLFGNSMNYMMSWYAPAALTGWVYFVTFVSLIFLVIQIVLMSMAINPLKMMKKHGWDLMFLVLLVSTASMIVNFFINYNSLNPITSLLVGVIAFVIDAYLLFEVRSYFIKAK
jgi:hypothetical protein